MPAAQKIVHNIPNLLTFWDFQSDDNLTASGQYAYTLTPMNGLPTPIENGVFGRSVYLQRGQWFSIPRADCPALNIHGAGAQVSVVGWVKRLPQPPTQDCETIAGVWDESRKKRQYCLFLDLPIWDSQNQVGAHVSYHGGPTDGYPYCMDAAIGETVLTYDRWHCVGMTYDGEYARAYLDGTLDTREGRNPFYYPQGLFDGGHDGADFTVGAVSRSGEPGNFFHGMLGGVAVFNRALSDVEMGALAALCPPYMR